MNFKGVRTKGIVAFLAVATLTGQLTYPVLANTTQNVKQQGTYNQTAEQDIEEIRSRLYSQVIGCFPGGTLDLTIPQYAKYVENLNTEANGNWASMEKSTNTARTYLWATEVLKTPYQDKMHAAQITTIYKRLLSLAKAYRTNGTDLYQNEEVKNEVIAALDFLIADKWYPKAAGDKGNWWDWEIGVPKSLTQIMVIFEDFLTPDQRATYLEAMKKSNAHVMKESDTPSNFSDKALQALYIGALEGNEALLLEVGTKTQKQLFKTVSSGNGFYADGSYIDHSYYAYTGGYGIVLMSAMSKVLPMISETQFEIQSNFFNDRVFDAFEPLTANGNLMQMVSGRGATRRKEQDHEKGKGITSIVAVLSRGMVGEQKIAAQRFVKDMISKNPEFILDHPDVYRLSAMLEIWNDNTIQPRGPLEMHKNYASMDKVVHHTNDFSFGLSMHSSRTANAECGNNEGYKTWNTSDGMTFIYNNDIKQFNDEWYPTVDKNRLPGTTTENAYRNKGKGHGLKNAYSWVGGTDLYDRYGVSGMQTRALSGGDNPTRTGAEAKKSYFMFDDEIVAVGSDIASTTGNTVETIVENRKIKDDASNTFLVNGDNVGGTTGYAYDDAVTSDIKGKTIDNVTWAHLEGNVAGADIGYYFPSASNMKVLVEPRTGNWVDINTGFGHDQLPDYTRTYASLLFDHGQNPADATYQYVLLPGKNAEETKAYTGNPNIEVLEVSSNVHAVRENKLGITGYNFWAAAQADGITANNPCSVMIGKKDAKIDISLSDPTQKQPEISVIIPGTYDVVAKDPAINVTYVQEGLKITVDTRASLGRTYKLELKEGNKELTASNITIGGIQVDGFNPNISIYSVKLPYGTTKVPAVKVTSAHDVKVTEPTSLPGRITVELTDKQDATKKDFYYIDVDVETQYIKASSEEADKGNVKENTLDGVEGTRWVSQGDGEWIQYYIGENKTIEELGIQFFYPNNIRKYNYSVAISMDEKEWTTIYDHKTSNGLGEGIIPHTFDAGTEARFIRITGHANNQNDFNCIDEVTFKLGDKEVIHTPAATLQGVSEVNAEENFSLTLGIEEANEVYAQDITVNYDETLFEFKGTTNLGKTQVIGMDDTKAGVVRILSMTEGGAVGAQELLALNFKAKPATGDYQGTVSVSEMLLGHVETGVSTTSSALTIAKEIKVVGTPIVETKPGDVNQDDSVDIADLALAAYYYHAKSGDANWEKAKFADMNNNGEIDITDLAMIANKILEN